MTEVSQERTFHKKGERPKKSKEIKEKMATDFLLLLSCDTLLRLYLCRELSMEEKERMKIHKSYSYTVAAHLAL